MAQAGYTPILIYASGTATNIPTAGNLISGSSGAELAINYADGKLYYKDGSGNVKLLSIGYGSSSVTPTNGGVQYGTGTALALTAAGSSGQILRSNGAAAPTWADLSTLGVNTISFGTTGLTPNSATAGAVTVAGTLVTANGGTGLGGATPFTANGVLYASSASALTSGSALTFDGSTLKATVSANSAVTANNVTSELSIQSVGNDGYINMTGTGGTVFRLGSGYTEAMRLTSTGLGIGTSSPAAKLDVKGGTTISTLAGWNTLSNSMFELANPAVRFGIGYDSSDQVLLQGFDSSNAARNIGMQVYGGNVGIGTSSPSSVLHISNAATPTITLTDTRTPVSAQYQVGSSIAFIGTTTNHPVGFTTNNTERMRLDSSGNLGLGVTPSALLWPNGSAGGLQLQAGALLSAYNATTYLSNNWYYNAGEKYIGNGYATRYEQTQGKHAWYYAGNNTSGAGATVSWTQAMTLDASGRLFVGTTSGATKLDVRGTSNTVESTIQIVGNTVSSLLLGQNADGGVIRGQGGNNALTFWTGGSGDTGAGQSGTERARITSGGVLDLATGVGAVGQIQFPATQVASSNANTLDDYEEGTFSPTIATSGANVTYTQQTGNYTKVGRLVTFGLTITLNTVTSAGSGDFEIGGLPFASSSSDVNQTRLVIQTNGVDFDATAYDFYAYIPTTSVSILKVLYSYDNGAWAPAQASNFVIAAGDLIVVTGFYYTTT